MLIVLLMTSETILRGGLHVRNRAVVEVTLGAGRSRVFANQSKRDFIMVELRAVRIDSVVTSHTVHPKREGVSLSESFIDLQMAGRAGRLIERRSVIFDVAIFTTKRGTVRFSLMRRENKLDGVMVEARGSPIFDRVTAIALRS